MNKKVILAMFIPILLTLSGLGTILSANSKFELISSDETLAKSERKVVMGISELGLEAKKFSFPVYYKSAAKNSKRVYVGNWSAKISQEYANSALSDNYTFLIPNRYDKLVFEKEQAKILTATKDIAVDTKLLKPFEFNPGSYRSFKESTLNYLNSEIAAKITPVLSSAKEARYKEMSSQEAQTFITTKAKEIGMPASVLQKLIDSAYTFSVYMPKMRGTILITQVISTDSQGRVSIYYSTSLSAPITLKLAIYKFSKGKFSLESEVTSKSSGNLFESLANGMSGSSGVTTLFRPSEKDAQRIFYDVFNTSFKDNLMALSTKVKENRAFAVSAPLESVDGSQVSMSIGVQEDIRVDHPFKIVREEDGEEKLVGYMRVKKAGDNCLLLPQEQRSSSEASMLSGSAEIADMAIEHPWTGVFGSVNFENTQGTFDSSKIGETDTGATKMLNIGFNGDLGYILNKKSLSEVWMKMNFGFGSATYGKLPSYDNNNLTPVSSNGSAMKFGFGFEKRFNIFEGIYFSGGADLDYELQSYDYSDNYSLSLATFSFTPQAKIGYMINHNLDLFGSLGYNMPLGTTHKLSDSDDNEFALSDSYDKQNGVNIMFGINMHINFAGPFAKMVSKPSTRCNNLKR